MQPLPYAMKPTPWLEKEDELWAQTVKWNAGREILFHNSHRGRQTYLAAKSCPLIEEAVWFLKACGYQYYPVGNDITSSLRQAAKTDPRAALYIAVINRNKERLRELANAENPIAQCHANPLNSREEFSWLSRSVSSGYSLAFAKLGELYDVIHQYDKMNDYLVKGIQAGSAEAMVLYSKVSAIDQRDQIYWLGRAWLEQIRQADEFTTDCRFWYADFLVGDAGSDQGFIYGHIFERAGKWRRKGMREDKKNGKNYTALQAAHNLYIQMTSKTREATYEWILIGKELGVVKDIINLIARLVWRSRDQVQWFTSNQTSQDE